MTEEPTILIKITISEILDDIKDTGKEDNYERGYLRIRDRIDYYQEVVETGKLKVQK